MERHPALNAVQLLVDENRLLKTKVLQLEADILKARKQIEFKDLQVYRA